MDFLKRLLAKIIGLLVKAVQPFCHRTVIPDHENPDEPYLIRYILFKSKRLSVYIHRFMCSDYGQHHDHPWNFYTYVIEGGYREERLVQDGTPRGNLELQYVDRKPGSLAYRRAEDMHKVLAPSRLPLEDEKKAPLTICIIFRRRRIWGFVEKTKDGYKWRNWIDYLGISEDDPRFYGSE